MRRKPVVLFLVVISLLFSTADAKRPAPQEKAGNLDARIQRIEKGLIPNPGFILKGETPTLVSLLSRMADYKVPGVSIAVISDHKIEWAKGYGLKEAGGILSHSAGLTVSGFPGYAQGAAIQRLPTSAASPSRSCCPSGDNPTRSFLRP